MYLKAGEPLDEDRTQARYMGAGAVWRSGLRRRQGPALWAAEGDEAGTVGLGRYT